MTADQEDHHVHASLPHSRAPVSAVRACCQGGFRDKPSMVFYFTCSDCAILVGCLRGHAADRAI